MKKYLISLSFSLAVALGIALTIAGCSSSTSAPQGFILQFTSMPAVNINDQAIFNFQVTNNGVAVAGAILVANVYELNVPKADTITENAIVLKSDASGAFNGIGLQLDAKTTGVIFQSFKDTLKSNQLSWHQ